MKKRVVVMKRSGLAEWNNCSYSFCSSATVRYGECWRNQAANIGGHAVDGCREFMESGEDGSDGAFTCAACGCHRNFHRKYVD